MTINFAVSVLDLELEPWPLRPDQVLAGAPATFGKVLDQSSDGRVERGVWEHTPGVTCHVEDDELFVVITGSATVEFEDGLVLDVGPGDVGLLRKGIHTKWTVHERLRKVYQTTS